MTDRRALARAEYERRAVPGTIAFLAEAEGLRDEVGWAREWLEEKAREESAAREAAQLDLNRKSVEAAQLSAQTSQAAAEASRQSAKWTMIAAVVAAISALISLAGIIIQAVSGASQ
jgi:hypothetical protein